MDLLTVEMKTMLAKKLLFALNFRLMTNEDFFKLFDLHVLDIIDGEVVKFDLIFKEESEVYITFIKLNTGEFIVHYRLISSLVNGVSNRFEVFVERSSIYSEYIDTINKLFEIVTEMEREEQFKKMDSSINRIINHK